MQITDYEPKLLWKHFNEIRQIPRCSGHEERARAYVLEYAKERGYEAEHDAAGNVVIRVPATAGHESAAIVAIQGHLDMVCEKNADVEHDFSKDPIQLVIDGDWLKANGTTLGSDNGIGVAAGLASADDETLVHGPLELLFTVDEEVGLTGAGKLQPGFLKAKFLLNLDSEELGAVFIGCAGGGDSTITLPVSKTGAGGAGVRLHVSGLRGGHSGLDIREQRGNAIKVLTRTLWEARERFDLQLATVDGGNKRNAIPREASAVILMPDGDRSAFSTWLSALRDTISDELGGQEPDLKMEIENIDAPAVVMDADSRDRLLNLLMAIPHGVCAMSYDIPDLVETSSNLASVSTRDGEVVIGTSSRSSINTALQFVRDQINSAATLAGARYEEDEPYPGWKPNVKSDLLGITRRVHQELFGEEPEALAVHAGLECGIIGEKFPGMDMISFGPEIQHPHSPDERINIPSVEKFWALLAGVLKALA